MIAQVVRNVIVEFAVQHLLQKVGEKECCNRGYGNITSKGECVDEGTPYGNYICISEIFISPTYPEIR